MSKCCAHVFLALIACGFLHACSKPIDPPPAPITITQATFEPVYRAAKAIQGATGPGVTYGKFGELLQGLSTEIEIAKDHQMNDLDKKLVGYYVDALDAYKFSGALWKAKIDAHEDYWRGEIPVGFGGKISAEFADGLEKYKLDPAPRELELTHAKYSALPGTAIQTVWLFADNLLKTATEMYYGRSDGKTAK